jgi:hypothetical protein
VHLALLKYSVLRLALFVASLGLLYLLGVGGVLLLALAAAVSMALSYVLLRRQRDELALALEQRTHDRLATRQLRGADADAAAEDGTTPLS